MPDMTGLEHRAAANTMTPAEAIAALGFVGPRATTAAEVIDQVQEDHGDLLRHAAALRKAGFDQEGITEIVALGVELSKGKKAEVGETRTWGGEQFTKMGSGEWEKKPQAKRKGMDHDKRAAAAKTGPASPPKAAPKAAPKEDQEPLDDIGGHPAPRAKPAAPAAAGGASSKPGQGDSTRPGHDVIERYNQIRADAHGKGVRVAGQLKGYHTHVHLDRLEAQVSEAHAAKQVGAHAAAEKQGKAGAAEATVAQKKASPAAPAEGAAEAPHADPVKRDEAGRPAGHTKPSAPHEVHRLTVRVNELEAQLKHVETHAKAAHEKAMLAQFHRETAAVRRDPSPEGLDWLSKRISAFLHILTGATVGAAAGAMAGGPVGAVAGGLAGSKAGQALHARSMTKAVVVSKRTGQLLIKSEVNDAPIPIPSPPSKPTAANANAASYHGTMENWHDDQAATMASLRNAGAMPRGADPRELWDLADRHKQAAQAHQVAARSLNQVRPGRPEPHMQAAQAEVVANAFAASKDATAPRSPGEHHAIMAAHHAIANREIATAKESGAPRSIAHGQARDAHIHALMDPSGRSSQAAHNASHAAPPPGGGMQPPGGGWQPVPGGQHGGFRKQNGPGSWMYWYPNRHAAAAAAVHHEGAAARGVKEAGTEAIGKDKKNKKYNADRRMALEAATEHQDASDGAKRVAYRMNLEAQGQGDMFGAGAPHPEGGRAPAPPKAPEKAPEAPPGPAGGDSGGLKAKGPKKGAEPVKATGTNVGVMAHHLRDSKDGLIRHVAQASVPHLKRVIAAGLLEQHPDDKKAWRVTKEGVAAVKDASGFEDKHRGLLPTQATAHLRDAPSGDESKLSPGARDALHTRVGTLQATDPGRHGTISRSADFYRRNPAGYAFEKHLDELEAHGFVVHTHGVVGSGASYDKQMVSRLTPAGEKARAAGVARTAEEQGKKAKAAEAAEAEAKAKKPPAFPLDEKTTSDIGMPSDDEIKASHGAVNDHAVHAAKLGEASKLLHKKIGDNIVHHALEGARAMVAEVRKTKPKVKTPVIPETASPVSVRDHFEAAVTHMEKHLGKDKAAAWMDAHAGPQSPGMLANKPLTEALAKVDAAKQAHEDFNGGAAHAVFRADKDAPLRQVRNVSRDAGQAENTVHALRKRGFHAAIQGTSGLQSVVTNAPEHAPARTWMKQDVINHDAKGANGGDAGSHAEHAKVNGAADTVGADLHDPYGGKAPQGMHPTTGAQWSDPKIASWPSPEHAKKSAAYHREREAAHRKDAEYYQSSMHLRGIGMEHRSSEQNHSRLAEAAEHAATRPPSKAEKPPKAPERTGGGAAPPEPPQGPGKASDGPKVPGLRAKHDTNEHGHRDGLVPGQKLSLRDRHVIEHGGDHADAEVLPGGKFRWKGKEYDGGHSLMAAVHGSDKHQTTVRRYFKLGGEKQITKSLGELRALLHPHGVTVAPGDNSAVLSGNLRKADVPMYLWESQAGQRATLGADAAEALVRQLKGGG